MATALVAEVEQAKLGDRRAMRKILEATHGKVYALALRMLACPDDARDATQEVMIRVVGNLASFRGDSEITTWVFRIAVNYLSQARKSKVEQADYTFDLFSADLGCGLDDTLGKPSPSAEEQLLFQEVREGCTAAMLTCLDREHRLAFTLGDILELDGETAAEVLGIEPAAYRKRLSRARTKIVGFMKSSCGLAEPACACRCRKRVSAAVALGRLNAERLVFSGDPAEALRFPSLLVTIRKLEETQRAVALLRCTNDSVSVDEISTMINRAFASAVPDDRMES